MITEVSCFEKLIEEFSNISVEIELGPRIFAFSESAECNEEGLIEEDGNVEYKSIFEFYVKFQNEDKVYFTKYNDFYSKYFKSLNKLRFDFYEEIAYKIGNSNNKSHILNSLSEYKIRFSEILDNYYEHKIDLPGGIVNLKGNKIIQIHYSEDKPIHDDHKDRILDKYLNIQFETIEKIIKYLDEKIDLIKLQTLDEEHVSTHHSEKMSLNKRIFETHSFELNPDLFQTDSINAEKLKDFKEALYKAGYITQIDFRFFLKAFTNQIVQQPIVWIGSPNELYYLIKSLHDKNIIIRFKNYWDVTCKCFLAIDKQKKVCTPSYLQRCKTPTRGDQLRKLNSVIDILK
jgi:hypothetical protein